MKVAKETCVPLGRIRCMWHRPEVILGSSGSFRKHPIQEKSEKAVVEATRTAHGRVRNAMIRVGESAWPDSPVAPASSDVVTDAIKLNDVN